MLVHSYSEASTTHDDDNDDGKCTFIVQLSATHKLSYTAHKLLSSTEKTNSYINSNRFHGSTRIHTLALSQWKACNSALQLRRERGRWWPLTDRQQQMLHR